MADDRPPSVDKVARALVDSGLPQPLRVEVARQAIGDGVVDDAPDRARARARRLLRPVVNATGVLLHTNLGRAPLDVRHAASATNLELDLATGVRGSRQDAVAPLVALAAGAEAALVVNNGAAAVLLALAATAAGRGVAVARGELIEIGGGFRIPEVLAQSGARLVEVGTTNKTRLDDFAAAVDDDRRDVAVALKVHTSNYLISGFTHETSVRELAMLGVPVIVDVGSGLLDEACPWLAEGPPSWLRGEPGVRQTLEAGASLVCCSGDKLLGGPQAGLLLGSRDVIEQCARHPLARALRPGGLVLGALQQTALAYLRRDAHAVVFWRQATRPLDELRSRADELVAKAGIGEVVASEAVPGAGALPGVTIASLAIRVAGDVTSTLRAAEAPVIARVHEGATLLDLRTVEPEQDVHVLIALRALHDPS